MVFVRTWVIFFEVFVLFRFTQYFHHFFFYFPITASMMNSCLQITTLDTEVVPATNWHSLLHINDFTRTNLHQLFHTNDFKSTNLHQQLHINSFTATHFILKHTRQQLFMESSDEQLCKYFRAKYMLIWRYKLSVNVSQSFVLSEKKKGRYVGVNMIMCNRLNTKNIFNYNNFTS